MLLTPPIDCLAASSPCCASDGGLNLGAAGGIKAPDVHLPGVVLCTCSDHRWIADKRHIESSTEALLHVVQFGMYTDIYFDCIHATNRHSIVPSAAIFHV